MKRWSLVWLALGFACLFVSRFVVREVDDAGILREPFPFVPIGWFSISLGLILGGIYVFGRLSGGGGAPPREPD